MKSMTETRRPSLGRRGQPSANSNTVIVIDFSLWSECYVSDKGVRGRRSLGGEEKRAVLLWCFGASDVEELVLGGRWRQRRSTGAGQHRRDAT